MRWIYFTLAVFSVSIIWLIIEVNAIDRKYSQLIEEGALQQHLIQRVTFNSNRGYLLLFQAAYSNDTIRRKQLFSEMNGFAKLNTQIFDSLLKINSAYPKQIEHINHTIAARKMYKIKEQGYVQRINTSSRSLADFNNDPELDATFLRYQKSVNELFTTKNNQVLSISNQLTTETGNKSLLISAFSMLPIILLVVSVFLFGFLIRQVFSAFPKETH